MYRRIVFLGPPGCGKGTQAERLSARSGLPAISTGEMLRSAVAAGSDLGRKVDSIMASGELVDDATMADVVRERLEQPDAARGFLVDGYPRTLGQAKTLEGILAEAGLAVDAVLSIDVAEDELVRRALARQRADDKEEVIRKRLEVYGEATKPLIEYYRGLGLLLPMRGEQSIGEVERESRGPHSRSAIRPHPRVSADGAQDRGRDRAHGRGESHRARGARRGR